MKKIILLLLVAVMCCSFSACGDSREQNLQNALLSADSYIAKTDEENNWYSITSDYDEVSNIYCVTVCADVEYYKSYLANETEVDSNLFDTMLNAALKNADSKTEVISVIIATIKAMVVPMFDYFEDLETQVTFKYVNIDGSIVEY